MKHNKTVATAANLQTKSETAISAFRDLIAGLKTIYCSIHNFQGLPGPVAENNARKGFKTSSANVFPQLSVQQNGLSSGKVK